MPNININGNINISRDLFSRLLARGLLDEQGEVSADFLLYLHECLSRDCAGISAVMPVGTMHAVVDTTKEPANKEEQVTLKPTKDTSQKIDMKALSSSMNTLYGGSK